jgi:hypothetical protein
MGKINISLDDKLEERFRKAVFETKGMKKGNMSDAFQEALEAWISLQNKKKRGELDN